ncbi:bifunctional UDP-sugar hydrolase/5'-nucleotidase [uncultured Corynebacterium sp.]|uniref:bifunctional metallophosphatase/5'-nucleotidase n=1 Tax=uncultured Corynebacterium sp. TaxID=159447 RepID=UPI0025D63212|nr:bifunctional UDP-sugar hydrolase/5'-nucleotidase [uncultured Corynebacterium sp.]
MKRLSRLALVTVTATGLGLGALTAPAYALEGDSVELNILGVTDFHGHLAQSEEDGEMGAAGIACYVDAERAQNPNTSFVSVGDSIGGSPFASSILKDTPALQALSAIGLDASALGNHEFDRGYDDLVNRVSLDGTGEAQFPYLGANVVGGTPAPAASEIIELDGVRVAYVGAVTEETATLVSPAGIDGITFTGDIESINAEADRIVADDEADVVIALIHAGAVASDPFSLAVDVVFSGHTHFEMIDEGAPRDGKQPLVVIQGLEYGKVISDVEITYDRAAGAITNINARNVPAAEVIENCATPNLVVQGIVEAAETAAAEEGQKVIATIDNSFYRGANDEGAYGSNRGVESSLSNLIAEAGLWAINNSTNLNADIGVMNAGGVRADLAEGEVTFKDAFDTQNFGNTYGAVDITGAQFKEALEQQWKTSGDRPRLALGLSNNVQYSYDDTREQGDRITHITVNGAPINMDETYRITGSSFLLAGGDSFYAFAEGSGFQESGIVDIDLFNQYLVAHTDVSPRENHSSVGISLSGPGVAENGSLIAGQELTVDLSSLSYTGGEAKPSTVTVKLGAEEATAPVDTTIIPQLDTTGTATVTFTVPTGATEISLETNAGTTFVLPVTVEQEPVDEAPSTGSSVNELVGVAGIVAALAGVVGFVFNAVMGAALPASLAQIPALSQLNAQIQALAAQFM